MIIPFFSWLSDENFLHAVQFMTCSLCINRLGNLFCIAMMLFRYGWHFPELSKLITDNIAFVKTVKLVGTRENMGATDLSDILPEDVEEKVKEAAEISMGTEISEEDIMNIQSLCDEVLSINEYRTHLSDYLKARMLAMAPNLTVLVGETIGARLIAHSGSLVNLAKHPASTVQILGKNFFHLFIIIIEHKIASTLMIEGLVSLKITFYETQSVLITNNLGCLTFDL